MVLWEILKAFPSSDLYTPIVRPIKKQRAFWLEVEKHKIYKSFLSSLPLPKLAFKLLLPLQIRFFKHLDLSKYDIVISSSAGFAKFINTKGRTRNIAYIHTPPRFLWGYDTSVFHKIPWIVRLVFRPLISRWRRQDRKYAQKADILITNSKNIQAKIKEIYKKDARVIYPPADIKNLLEIKSTKKEDYFLTIGRLYSYKKIDLIVRTFKTLKEKLIVIGDGPQRKQLERLTENRKNETSNVEFKGFVDEDVKIELLRKAKGFIFAAEEDFGIVMVEALAAGTPVIAYGRGGSTEIVQDGKNGLLFEEQTPQSLKAAIEQFNKKKFDVKIIRQSSEKFSSENFRKSIRDLVDA